MRWPAVFAGGIIAGKVKEQAPADACSLTHLNCFNLRWEISRDSSSLSPCVIRKVVFRAWCSLNG